MTVDQVIMCSAVYSTDLFKRQDQRHSCTVSDNHSIVLSTALPEVKPEVVRPVNKSIRATWLLTSMFCHRMSGLLRGLQAKFVATSCALLHLSVVIGLLLLLRGLYCYFCYRVYCVYLPLHCHYCPPTAPRLPSKLPISKFSPSLVNLSWLALP